MQEATISARRPSYFISSLIGTESANGNHIYHRFLNLRYTCMLILIHVLFWMRVCSHRIVLLLNTCMLIWSLICTCFVLGVWVLDILEGCISSRSCERQVWIRYVTELPSVMEKVSRDCILHVIQPIPNSRFWLQYVSVPNACQTREMAQHKLREVKMLTMDLHVFSKFHRMTLTKQGMSHLPRPIYSFHVCLFSLIYQHSHLLRTIFRT